MNESQQTEFWVRTYLEHLPTPVQPDLDDRILAAALSAMRRSIGHPAPTGRTTWKDIMTGKAARRTAVATLVAVLVFAAFQSLTRPAWAFADAVAALRDFRAARMEVTFPGGTAEVWLRANDDLTQSTDAIVRTSQGAVTWTRDGSTYHYEPGQNMVTYQHALTVGASQWLGPELLEELSTLEDAQVVRGRDPATGRERVTLLCSLVDVHGPQSWVIEFDAATKLPVAMKQWSNLDREGPPAFDASRIVYYDDLPDDVFAARIPADAQYVEAPLEIPDDAVAQLSNPQDGISAEGMSQQQAATAAVRVLYRAVIDQDAKQLRSISPLTRNWGDEFLRRIIFRPGQDDRIVELLEIGPISTTGLSRLGPIVALPAVVRLQNGKKIEEQMIVQFRHLEGTASCVVHGPFGLPRELP